MRLKRCWQKESQDRQQPVGSSLWRRRSSTGASLKLAPDRQGQFGQDPAAGTSYRSALQFCNSVDCQRITSSAPAAVIPVKSQAMLVAIAPLFIKSSDQAGKLFSLSRLKIKAETFRRSLWRST